MQRTKLSYYIITVLSLCLLAFFLGIKMWGGENDHQFFIKKCNKNYYFDEFYQINNEREYVKKLSDKYLSKVIKIDNRSKNTDFCATAIEGKDSCIQYFQPDTSVGGSIRVCVNPKGKSLVSIEFGQ